MKIIPAIFEEHEIRRSYDEKTQAWFFSVVDIIQVLTQQPDYQASRKYWKVLKGRLAKEGSELVTNCYQLSTRQIAKRARLELEAQTGKKVVTGENYLPPGNAQKMLKVE